MNPLPSFSIWQFAVAGLCCALGPIIIHWLHRRRFRVLRWPAMEFLLRAAKRHQHRRQWRDIILMALRSVAILFIGFAIAGPFVNAQAPWTSRLAFALLPLFIISIIVSVVLWQKPGVRNIALFVAIAAVLVTTLVGWNESQNSDSSHQLAASRRPVHAVIWIDNSLSMSFRTLSGSSLERAKQRAEKFLSDLPSGSQFTIRPLLDDQFPTTTFDTTAAAIQRLNRIDIMDAAGSLDRLGAFADDASADEGLPRITLLFTDLQSNTLQEGLPDDLPDMQVIDVGPSTWRNAWIADLRLPDGVLRPGEATTVMVEVGYQGDERDRVVPVTLAVDEQVVGTRNVVFSQAGRQQVVFQYTFADTAATAGNHRWSVLSASIPDDQLGADNSQHRVLPVTEQLNVVFVDQLGEREDVEKLSIGETFTLRRILNAASTQVSVFNYHHLRIDQLTQKHLEEARLVVVAGIDNPGDRVALLRDFVTQGGQLLIAAGADFHSARWNESAWLDGQGILPLPLDEAFATAAPDSPLRLDASSLAEDEWIRIEGLDEQGLRTFYRAGIFFQAVQVQHSSDVLEKLRQADKDRFLDQAKAQESLRQLRAKKDTRTKEDDVREEALSATLRSNESNWLLWARQMSKEVGGFSGGRQEDAERMAQLASPRVLLQFQGGNPYAVERRIGAGRVVFLGSGLLAEWNLLARLNTALIYDRLTRELLRSTLPSSNHRTFQQVMLPLPRSMRGQSVIVDGPGGKNTRSVGFLDASRIGTTHLPLQRGVYRLNSSTDQNNDSGQQLLALWSASGDNRESEFTRRQIDWPADVRLVNANGTISLASGAVQHEQAWWYVSLLVGILLLAEMLFVSAPALKRAAVAPSPP